MKAVLIFDNVNDLLFSKWDDTFIERMRSFGDNDNEKLGITDSYNVSQLLSPIITSQRVMAAQFGNTYTSMQCKDNTTIVFDEWLDHVFLIISEADIDDAHRELLDCKTLVQHICGQNINLLRSPVYQKWLSELLESLSKGDSIPGASGVIGESGVTAAALTALKVAAKDVKIGSHQHYHLLLYVGDKLLALYSSKGCEDLQPPDIILLSLQSIAAQEHWSDARKTDNCKDNSHLPWLSEENSAIINLCAGNTGSPCAPHSMHIAEIAERVIFILLLDMDLRDISIPTHTSYQILSNLRRLLVQRNLELVPATLDSLETALKKSMESLRPGHAALSTRLRSRLLELRRAAAATAPLSPDTAAAGLHTALNTVLELLRPPIPSMNIEMLLNELRTALAPHMGFLKERAQIYFGLESSGAPSLEEYPGLVHYVYAHRGRARALAPHLHHSDLLSKEFVSSCVRRGLRYWREGYGGWSWRGAGRRVSAVRWGPGAPPHPAALRALPPPGDIMGAFYRQMSELSPTGGAVQELLVIHLGLVPPATALQQARRLAHSLADQQQDAKNLL